MSLPSPSFGESKEDFIKRFMKDSVAKKEFPDIKQRTAIAYQKFKTKNLSSEPNLLINAIKNIEGIKLLTFLTILILFISFTSAWDPRDNITMRDRYSILNGVSANFSTYYGNGSQLTGVTTSSANSSNYWDNLNVPSDLNNLVTIQGENISSGTISFARLPTLTNLITLDWNNLTNKVASDFNYLVLSKWGNISNAPTVLSFFTDDLGDRGYTSLSNFTNDNGYINSSSLANYYLNSNPFSFYNSTSLTSLSQLTDDLGNRGYTNNLNFTNGAGYYNSSTIPNYLTSESDPLWTSNQSSYSTTSQINTLIGSANTTMKTYVNEQDTTFNNSIKTYVDSINSSQTIWTDTIFVRFTELVNQIGNWSADKGSYYTNTQTDNLLALQDSCSEITGCVVNAITDGNTKWDNSYGLFNNITNFTGSMTNGKICIYDSSTQIINCTYTDQTGAIGNPKSGDGNYLYNTSSIMYFNSTYAGINLNVNSSNFWNGLNSPSGINAGDITDDGTYRLNSWDNFTGVPISTPSISDTTHLSTAKQIYDWIISLSYATTSLLNSLGNWSKDKSNYWNSSTDLDTAIATDEITELKIDFNTVCASGNHLYVSGNNLACEADADTTYTAGNGIGLTGTTFSVSGGTGLTQDVSGLSITANSVGDTQLAFDTGQSLTSSSSPTFATINTGNGANELYDMNQNVLTSSNVVFNQINVSSFSVVTVNITCFNSACTWYTNATDSCLYWESGGKDCSG